MTNKPIDNCYWVVPGKFLAGEYPRNLDDRSSPGKVDAFEKAGVASFIDLTEEGDKLPYTQWLNPETQSHRRFAIRDVNVPSSSALTSDILDTIDKDLAEGNVVYVHCMGGIGRTGTIVGCWLSRHGYQGEAALERLEELWADCPKSAWIRSPETEAQRRYIVNWREEEGR